jgi:glycosyltransferase involved in cell wall biosynthesis
MRKPRILVLSDIPACGNYTGGVVLADQFRYLPSDSLYSFVVLNEALIPEACPDLARITTKTVKKPQENWVAEPDRERAIAMETHNATVVTAELVAEAAAFGREHQVDAVFAVLEGQTIVRMATPLAKALGVPLYCQVWDPLSWWLDAHGVDQANAQHALDAFDDAIRASRGVATASQPMADLYARQYGARSFPVINSQDRSVARRPTPMLNSSDKLVIGMIGQFYADDAWKCLVQGLAEENWKVGRRDVHVYYLGHTPPADVPADRLINDGWMSQADAIDALSRHADVCYCPYPFDPKMEEVARLSFPSKAVAYMASGRPTFCHGPWYSSIAQYFSRSLAGVVCGDLDSGAAFRMLKWLVDDRQVYEDACMAARASFLRDFTKEKMRRNLEQVLQIGDFALERT